jgi:F-type H+-transporting ATPase subunit epsilon
MSNVSLKLQLITQERMVLEEEVRPVTLPGETGELTILPGHVNLFTKIKPGVVHVKPVDSHDPKVVVVGGGFADVSGTEVKILADTAVRAEEIDEAKAELARKAAEDAMKDKRSEQDYVMAEASLRKAMLELETARKWKKLR